MNLRIITQLVACMLMVQVLAPRLHAEFFKIDTVRSVLTLPKDKIGVWHDTKLAEGKINHSFVPCIEVSLHVEENTAAQNLYVRCYFYGKDNKLVQTSAAPSPSGDMYNHLKKLPPILRKDEGTRVFFEIPKEVKLNEDWHAVIVYGDKDEAVATSCPMTISASTFDYPEKKLVENRFAKNIKRKPAVDPLIEYVSKSTVPKSKNPQLTLFLRMPDGISDPSELQGVMAICVLWGGVDGIRNEMQKTDMTGDYKGLFPFANKNKLAILAWCGPGTKWDPSKNYDDMEDKDFRGMEKSLDEVAAMWENGVIALSEKYGIPKNNYLLWGVCRSAQWAQRLCLRKPNYFLGCYLLIPGSFDKPTLDASRVLWCLCTGELYGGYENSLKWYKECREMGYPMIYKAFEGLGHGVNADSMSIAFRFFEFALTQKDLREKYDKMMGGKMEVRSQASGQAQAPWPEAFRNPPFYGDIVNQEVYPADQVEMIPVGFRTPLPTKEIADLWGKTKP